MMKPSSRPTKGKMSVRMRASGPLPLLLFALLTITACRDSSAGGGFAERADPARWRQDYWYDGQAEINFYDAKLTYYGEPRETSREVHIVVSEDHDPKQLVKADDWRQPGLIKVLKFNQMRAVQTGVYDYRQMMSAFFDTSDGRFMKLTYGSQEWCGNTFKEVVNYGGTSSFEFNTYWDGQGNGDYEVDFPQDLIPYDSLPVQLRLLNWEIGARFDVELLPSQFSNRVAAPELRSAVIAIQAREAVEVAAGRFEAFRVIVTDAEGEDTFWFEAESPHRMLRWVTASGDVLDLRATKKMAYWKFNSPGDEAHLE